MFGHQSNGLLAAVLGLAGVTVVIYSAFDVLYQRKRQSIHMCTHCIPPVTANNSNDEKRIDEKVPLWHRVSADWRAKILNRIRRVKDRCLKHRIAKPLSRNMLSNLYVDDRHGIIFCSVPKVACSNWKLILLILSADVSPLDYEKIPLASVHSGEFSKHVKLLKTHTLYGIQYRLNHYFKFFFVRHPLERILSAYRDKLESAKPSTYYPSVVGTKILQRYREHPTQRKLRTGTSVTFSEFLLFIRDENLNGHSFDVHWKEFFHLCHPCSIQYDVIGHYETLADDSENILRLLGAGDRIRFPDYHGGKIHVNTSSSVGGYYKDIDIKLLKQVWKIYRRDGDMFGYRFDDFLINHLNRTV